MNILQGDVNSDFKITAIVQIPGSQVFFYDNDSKNVVQNVYLISQNANKTDGATEIIEEYVKNGNGTAISICGWGYADGKLNPTQTRYLIIIEPKGSN